MKSLANLITVRKIVCPYDLTEVSFRKEIENCPKCKEEIPIQYLHDYKAAPPFFAQIIGWSQVGKTVYLQALTLILVQMGYIWQRHYSYAPFTEATQRYVENVREFLKTGIMPKVTQLELQQAYIMLLKGMERWGGRTMVLRDVAGEVFNSFEFPLQYTPYLLHVPTTMLMISLDDIRQNSSKSIDDLIHSYIQTMMKFDPKFRREPRNIIVVLSKGDLIINQLPTNISNYLVKDPILNAIKSKSNHALDGVEMNKYMERLVRVSSVIQDWISQDVAGKNLILRAEDNNIHLEFTIVSSTGRPVGENGALPVQLEPYRVLDPFFWALEFQSR